MKHRRETEEFAMKKEPKSRSNSEVGTEGSEEVFKPRPVGLPVGGATMDPSMVNMLPSPQDPQTMMQAMGTAGHPPMSPYVQYLMQPGMYMPNIQGGVNIPGMIMPAAAAPNMADMATMQNLPTTQAVGMSSVSAQQQQSQPVRTAAPSASGLTNGGGTDVASSTAQQTQIAPDANKNQNAVDMTRKRTDSQGAALQDQKQKVVTDDLLFKLVDNLGDARTIPVSQSEPKLSLNQLKVTQKMKELESNTQKTQQGAPQAVGVAGSILGPAASLESNSNNVKRSQSMKDRTKPVKLDARSASSTPQTSPRLMRKFSLTSNSQLQQQQQQHQQFVQQQGQVFTQQQQQQQYQQQSLQYAPGGQLPNYGYIIPQQFAAAAAAQQPPTQYMPAFQGQFPQQFLMAAQGAPPPHPHQGMWLNPNVNVNQQSMNAQYQAMALAAAAVAAQGVAPPQSQPQQPQQQLPPTSQPFNPATNLIQGSSNSSTLSTKSTSSVPPQ